jgi:two-component system, sensor histidine kinase
VRWFKRSLEFLNTHKRKSTISEQPNSPFGLSLPFSSSESRQSPFSEKAEPKPMSSEDMLRLCQCLPYPCILWQRHGSQIEVIATNASAQPWLGPEGFAHTSLKAIRESSLVACQTNEVIKKDLVGKSLGGQDYFFELSFRPLFLTREKRDHSDIEFCMLTIIDVNGVKHKLHKLEKQVRQLKQESTAKSDFLAMMSHEIRTPMTSIMGYAEMMLNPLQTHSERMQAVSVIRRNSKQLLELVNELLDISKIESGTFDLTRENLEVRSFINEMVSSLLPLADGKNLSMRSLVHAEVPSHFETDAKKLRQVLMNLIGNAIKYTERGEIVIDVNTSGTRLNFDVKDTGVGTPADQQAYLFKPFSRADTSLTRRVSGTGLGLHLAREMARHMGGDVLLLESEFGKGSTFRCWMEHAQKQTHTLAQRVSLRPAENPKPKEDTTRVLASDQNKTPHQTETSAQTQPLIYPIGSHTASIASAVSAQSTKATEWNLVGRKILVVDDSQENSNYVGSLLKKQGAEVVAASDGISGVSKALLGQFDVVLMDLQMPYMNGLEAAKELRRRGYKKPIVALSAHAMQRDKELSLQAGCNAHIAKPVDPRTLFDLLKPFVGGPPQPATSAFTS